MTQPARRFVRLVDEMKACRLCAPALPLGPRPVFQLDPRARILIAGQAPGRRVHASGVPFDDPSGDRLRHWLGVDRATFYDATRIAILPMGLCFPGTGRSGDLPPRPECAATWRRRVLSEMRHVAMTLVIGRFAQAWHLGSDARDGVTSTVSAWQRFAPQVWPLPHPSPRNQRWVRDNAWFESEVLPSLKRRVAEVLGAPQPVEGHALRSPSAP